MDQLAVMFSQLGKAAAQIARETTRITAEDDDITAVGVKGKANAEWGLAQPKATFELV